jgi:hypothetical protein
VEELVWPKGNDIRFFLPCCQYLAFFKTYNFLNVLNHILCYKLVLWILYYVVPSVNSEYICTFSVLNNQYCWLSNLLSSYISTFLCIVTVGHRLFVVIISMLFMVVMGMPSLCCMSYAFVLCKQGM